MHELAGTVSEVKAPSTSPLKAGRAKIPGHLSKGARAEFKRMQKILLERGHGTPGDATTLVLYAETFSRWVAAKAAIEAEGLRVPDTVLDSNGEAITRMRNHQLLPTVAACERQLLSYAKSMGLTSR